MKIGLVCNYYIYNYGSVLQSYALQQFVCNTGREIEVINYHDVANRAQKVEILLKLKLKDLLNINKIVSKLNMKREMKCDESYFHIVYERKKSYDEFVAKHFFLSKKCGSISEVQRLCAEYHTILLSSDQLWGPADLIRDYHTLRQFPKNKKRVAYATSFGVANLPTFLNTVVYDFIPQIDCVSVREKSGQNLIKKICGRDVPVVVDPTMLLSKEQWKAVFSEDRIIKERYVFCYFLGENKKHIQAVKEFCGEKKLKLVSILHPENYNTKGYRFADIYPDGVGPAEFLNLIYNAEYVVSDSFHASVFSSIFNKKFMVFDRYNSTAGESRNTRIENLLNMLELTDRHFTYQNTLSSLMDKEIDWCLVSRRLEQSRNYSIEYLENSL